MALQLDGVLKRQDDFIRERSRAIDHLLRLLAFIVSVAVFFTCAKVYSCLVADDWAGVFACLAILLTIIPIFQGMQRALDLKYRNPLNGVTGLFAILSDYVVLIILAVSFLVMAQTIPDHAPANQSQVAILENQSSARLVEVEERELFYPDIAERRLHFLLAILFFFVFDTLTLYWPTMWSYPELRRDLRAQLDPGVEASERQQALVRLVRAYRNQRELFRSSHRTFILLNGSVAVLVAIVLLIYCRLILPEVVAVPYSEARSLAVEQDAAVCMALVAFATLTRSLLDYRLSGSFWFPMDEVPRKPGRQFDETGAV